MAQFLMQQVSIPDNVLMRELDGESVILDLASEKYFGLDEIGTRMWQVLAGTDTVQEAYDILLLEYDVEPQQLLQDLQELVEELVGSDLLRLESGQSAVGSAG
jgi:hypothetical protein